MSQVRHRTNPPWWNSGADETVTSLAAAMREITALSAAREQLLAVNAA